MSNLLNTKQLAKKLAIKESRVRTMVFRKEIPVVRVGRLVRFDLKEVEKFIKEKTDNVEKKEVQQTIWKDPFKRINKVTIEVNQRRIHKLNNELSDLKVRRNVLKDHLNIFVSKADEKIKALENEIDNCQKRIEGLRYL